MLSKTIQIPSKLVSMHLSASVKISELIRSKAITQGQVCQVFHSLRQLPTLITTRAMSGSPKLESLVRVRLGSQNMLHSNNLAPSLAVTAASFRIKLNLRHKTPSSRSVLHISRTCLGYSKIRATRNHSVNLESSLVAINNPALRVTAEGKVTPVSCFRIKGRYRS